MDRRSFVEVLAASQTPVNQTWFQGTADAVRQYFWLFEDAMREGVQDFLILAGDHLYRMDYSKFVHAHRTSGADVTIAACSCDDSRASSFGLMKINETGRIIEFAEKPSGRELDAMKVDTTVLGLDPETAKAKPYIASLGIYMMKADKLKELLHNHYPEANDFGSEVIPGANKLGAHVQAYLFNGYWMDIGTIESFYHANLGMCGADPVFSFYNIDAPIFTASRFLPPSKILDAELSTSILGDGCVIKPGSKIIRSVIGLRSLVGDNCIVENSLLMGADYYETLQECETVPGCLPIGLGPNTHIKRSIIDKNVRIGANVKLINKEGVNEANLEDRGFIIKDGILVVVKDTIIPSGTCI
jgi:glucose-1-phosphate adenylyltransferase